MITGAGCHFPSPGNVPDPGIKPRPPALQVDCLPSELPYTPPNLKARIIQERELFYADLANSCNTLVMWSIHKLSVKWVWWDSREEVVHSWRPPTWLLHRHTQRIPMQQHWTRYRRKNNPCPPGLHHPEGGRQLRLQHWYHMPRKATAKLLWRTPTNTN